MLPNLIVPTLTRYDLLQRMISSIDYPVKHLLIIDNGNLIDQLKLPAEVVDMTLLTMPANLGCASSWNLGIKSFPFDDRWFIVSDDVEFEPGALEAWHGMSSPERMIVSDQWPYFQVMAIGEDVVDQVGLFDEAIHPANFEDDEYEWRASQLGFQVERMPIDHKHVGQATVFAPGLVEKNTESYPLNEIYFRYKQSQNDLSSGEWSLNRRRTNAWDMPVQ
jgi:GT2 family glycosyltransferase